MKPKYLQSAPNLCERWIVSYTDVLTILLIFFLTAAAKSLEGPPAKVQPLAPTRPPAARLEAEVRPASLLQARERLQARGLNPRLETRGLVISLPQAILFPSGEATVSVQALPTLAQIAEVLRGVPNQIRLIGNADTVPIHNRHFRSNWDLSMARSLRILEILSDRFGVAESRFSIASYGPYHPAAPNDTADGRASNRRVEIVILDDGSDS